MIAANDYYPYGMTIAGRTFSSDPEKDKFKFQSKERDAETGYDYFEARLYDSDIGRFLQVDPLSEKFVTMSAFTGMANNPITMIDPNGMNWFYYKKDGEEEASWYWHEGDTRTYTDADGNEQTQTSQYVYMVLYTITGYNDEGAAIGKLQVFHQNDEVLNASNVFTGGGPNNFFEVQNGTYLMRLDIRDKNGPIGGNAKLDNPLPHFGIQKIPNRWIDIGDGLRMDVGGAYGKGRIRLLEVNKKTLKASGKLIAAKQQKRGYYLHGKLQEHNYTHGCVCDKSEAVFNYFWKGAGSKYQSKVPFVIKR